ncbi:metal ABC transporter permease, partial [Kibdelosporangium lantanae]
MDKFFDFDKTLEVMQYAFVRDALLAAAILGLLAGVLGPLIVSRNMAFSVHGTSELAVTGGA